MSGFLLWFMSEAYYLYTAGKNPGNLMVSEILLLTLTLNSSFYAASDL